MAFGDRLAAVRRGNGLTQEQFAEQLQVSRQAVSKWESGRGYPEMEKILYICNRYQVSIADLFAEEAPVPAAAVEARPAPEQEAAPLPRATLGSAVGAFAKVMMSVKNNTRLWANKGHTPNELAALYYRGAPTADGTGRKKIGRNDLCPCGSGKKFKKCCGR